MEYWNLETTVDILTIEVIFFLFHLVSATHYSAELG